MGSCQNDSARVPSCRSSVSVQVSESEDEPSGLPSPRPAPPYQLARRFSVQGTRAKRCPTCHGSGRLPLEGDSELMALIPYQDQRLKPRRTKLKVFVAVVTVIVICAVLVFFLYPRSPTVSVFASTLSHNATSADTFAITLEVNCTLRNNNFFSMSVQDIGIIIKQVSDIIGTNAFSVRQSIGAHSSVHLTGYAQAIISGDQGRHVVQSCKLDRIAKVFLQVNVQVVTSFLANTAQINSNVPNFFSCKDSA